MSAFQNTGSPGQDRLNQIIAAYLEAIEAGESLDRQELLDRHPDLAEDLEAFFTDHDKMKELAKPIATGEQRPVADPSDDARTLPPRKRQASPPLGRDDREAYRSTVRT